MSKLIPEQVLQVIAALKEKGVDSWVIGGAVRDTLLGRPVHDWDLTAAGTPEEIAIALPDAKPIGGEFGTVTWHGIEITPCRAERDYADHRHPNVITFGTDLRVDLSRRDFTINAMAWDGELVIDPYHGRYDLQDKLLRAVGDPAVRFDEDALRILRLYRFAGVLGFAVEEHTGAAALALSNTMQYVSAPRVRGELDKALKGSHPSALAPLIVVGALEPFGIDGASLREVAATALLEVQRTGCDGGACARDAATRCTAVAAEHLASLDKVPVSPLCRWWAFLRLTDSEMEKAAQLLGFGKQMVKDFEKLNALFFRGMPENMHALKLTLSEGYSFSFAQVAETFAALDESFAGLPQMYRTLVESGEPYLKEHLQITPTALMGMGFKGKELGKFQRLMLKAVIDTPAYNTQEGLAELAFAMKELPL